MQASIAADRRPVAFDHEREQEQGLLERLRSAPTAAIGKWPTPLQRFDRRGRCDLLVKRDDLSGFGRGGAKTRKISHLLGHLRARGYDELLAVAGNITNLAFDLAAAERTCGFRTRVFIVDDPPAPPAERERIFAGVRDRVLLLGPSRVTAAATVLRAAWASRRAGGRPFVALPGASHPASVIGNACGFLEMVEQLDLAGAPLPRAVYVTAATGTMVAGFLLAAEALAAAGRPRIAVRGVQAYPGAVAWRAWGLLRWTERFLESSGASSRRAPVGPADFVTSPRGFAEFEPEVTSVCARVRDEAGIDVDPIFGGKSWRAMELDAAANAPGERPLLYWHCGYTPEWQTLCGWVGRGDRRAA